MKNNYLYEEYFQKRLVPDALEMRGSLSYILKNKNGLLRDFLYDNGKDIYSEFIENGLISQVCELDKTNRHMQMSWQLNYNHGNIAKKIYIRLYGWIAYIKLMYFLPKHKII